MAQRPGTSRVIICFVVAATVGLVATIVLLCLGALGAQIATVIAAYFGLWGILIASYPLYLQRSSEEKSSDKPPSTPQGMTETESSGEPRGLASNYRTIAPIGVVLTILVCCLCVADMQPIGDKTLTVDSTVNTLKVAGNVTLLQQDAWLKNQGALVFQLTDAALV